MPEATIPTKITNADVDSVIWTLAVGVNDGQHARLNLMLDAGEALAGTGADVKAACQRMDEVSANLSIAPSSLQVELGKAIAVIEHFGGRKDADAEIDAFNFGSSAKHVAPSGKKYDAPKRPCYNIRTLAVKLGVVKEASKGPSALVKRLDAAVAAGIITKSQAVNIAALEV
jgi:hypothetical protein